ncbi:Wadjet anti-phage system protein JetD domain-containing protein [uncultured Prevotella sp.]|uniref:Wadjet anti-phage system protein JetD domain-containing protein n=1 Tax=uncultured Prevotella sp. TaxID=159272 RepID=UPI002603B77C|nr:Wadjet anti-phage system protein JetD domain-containing protein [uncultured Prevotella sp.]
MITSAEIKKKALRKYTDYLRNVAAGITFQQIEIPCNKKASDTIAEYQREFYDIRSLSKEVKGYGYTIEWKTIKNKMLGTQDFPSKIMFETADDFERFLQKVKEVADFRKNVALINDKFSKLQHWIEKYPQKVIDNSEDWNNILKVLDYFSKNPLPKLYIRELPIEVHTKFVEQHKAVISELLDIVIEEYVDKNEKDFEKRYGLRYDEPMVRMRLLDETLATSYFSGLDDITIPVSLFLKLKMSISMAYIVENKVNFLTFPPVAKSIVIWGKGYGVASIKDSELLKSTELVYWGDLDAQGFEILSQFRSYFARVKSLLMDKATFDKYFENDLGTPSKINTKLNLTTEEEELYSYIKTNNYRLEQEKIPQSYVVEKLKCRFV